jgi:hypothetical protein
VTGWRVAFAAGITAAAVAFFVFSVRGDDLGTALAGAVGAGIVFAGLTEIWIWAL